MAAPPDAVLIPPGSKSLTNRALLCAAMADGESRVAGVLFADDTRAMLGAIAALGAEVSADEASSTVHVTGADPTIRSRPAAVDAGQSGTTSRFVMPAVSLASTRGTVDGGPQLRSRPFGPLLHALRALGVTIEDLGTPGRLPVGITGPARGGPVSLAGHLSSQFLSGLLLAGPLMPQGLEIRLETPLVSVPYVRMTEGVMSAFGVEVVNLAVAPAAYRATDYQVEPDASAASYLLAAAAITGGRVRVEGLGTASAQGDVGFADVLEQMGATVERTTTSITVTGGDRLQGIDVDLSDLSDTAQTLAAVAVFADGPTRVRGIGFIRGKETNRIRAVVTELRRAGIDAREDDDGFTIQPGEPEPTRFRTYDDHRMAMSFALIGLRSPGIEIADPACVAKTYPRYFDDLRLLAER